MSKPWTSRRCLAAILLLLPASVAASRLGADDQSPAPATAGPASAAAQIRQLSAKYRAAGAQPPRRAAVLKDLAAVGPKGVAAAKDLIGKELQIAQAQADHTPNTKALDEKIAELRKILADLRKDPHLSHAKTENIGLPALTQLTSLYGQWTNQMAPYKKKMARVAAQLGRLDEVLRLLRADWGKDPPLPLGDYQAKIKKLLDVAYPPKEQEYAKVLEEDARMAPELRPEIVTGMQAVNNIRMICGLNPLLYDVKLCEAARGHSADMQRLNFFAHESPVPGKTLPWDRAKLEGTTASGENIFRGSAVAAEAIKGWFLSPGHHKNMLGEGHRRQGLGRAGEYWTEEFGD